MIDTRPRNKMPSRKRWHRCIWALFALGNYSNWDAQLSFPHRWSSNPSFSIRRLSSQAMIPSRHRDRLTEPTSIARHRAASPVPGASFRAKISTLCSRLVPTQKHCQNRGETDTDDGETRSIEKHEPEEWVSPCCTTDGTQYNTNDDATGRPAPGRSQCDRGVASPSGSCRRNGEMI